MKGALFVFSCLCIGLITGCASDNTRQYPVMEVMQTRYSNLIPTDIAISFQTGEGTLVGKNIIFQGFSGIDYDEKNKKYSPFENYDSAVKDACYRSFAEAIHSSAEIARKRDARQVIQLKSYVKRTLTSNPEIFLCGIENKRVSVSLMGDIAE